MSRAPKAVTPSPSALVARMAAGDDRALGALYDAYGQVAYALALAITGARATAESVVADSFAEAWRTAAAFESAQGSVLAWLTAIVRRKAHASWRDPPCTSFVRRSPGGAVIDDHVMTRA